jgi:hypothetical protein
MRLEALSDVGVARTKAAGATSMSEDHDPASASRHTEYAWKLAIADYDVGCGNE